jgi:hypothetical protein
LSLIGKPPIDTSTIKDFTLGPWVFAGITIPPNILPVLPGLAGIIDPPLQALRLAIAWGAVVLIALGSVVLGFAASKVIGFINLLRTPAGRALVLTNVGIFFFFFVLFTGLFFMSVVR